MKFFLISAKDGKNAALDYSRYIRRYPSSKHCGNNYCKDLNYREHYHCLDCNFRVRISFHFYFPFLFHRCTSLTESRRVFAAKLRPCSDSLTMELCKFCRQPMQVTSCCDSYSTLPVSEFYSGINLSITWRGVFSTPPTSAASSTSSERLIENNDDASYRKKLIEFLALCLFVRALNLMLQLELHFIHALRRLSNSCRSSEATTSFALSDTFRITP